MLAMASKETQPIRAQWPKLLRAYPSVVSDIPVQDISN